MEALTRLCTRAARYWQTYAMLAGVGFGLILLLAATGFRLLGWVFGFMIAIALLYNWFALFTQSNAQKLADEPLAPWLSTEKSSSDLDEGTGR